MESTMKEIMEMHSKIANDPWVLARQRHDSHYKALRSLEDEQNKKLINEWHTKPNINERMDRFLLMQKQECEMLQNLQQNECYQKVRVNNESLENTMGRYLEKEKNEDLYRDRYSQFLRENDPQLRKLATQLREAHVNKIRLAQIDEKERNKSVIDKADIPYVRALEEKQKADEQQEKLELFHEEERKYKLRYLLQQQMQEKELFNEENKMKEEDKIRIDAIVKSDLEEIRAEQEREFIKKMALRKSYQDCIKEKEDYLKTQRQRLREQDNQLKEYTEFTDKRKFDLLKLKKEKEECLHEVQERLGDLLKRKQRDIDEFEEARQDVTIAESEMAAFRNDQIERAAKEKAKREYIAELDKCREANRLYDIEEKLRNQNIDAEVDKVNKIKIEEERQRLLKKKEENIVFKNECQSDIAYKIREKQKCLEEEMERDRLYKENTEKYDKDVENERIAMIKEMAPHLYPGCIPRGMLREEEIKYLDNPLKNFLLNKTSYPDL